MGTTANPALIVTAAGFPLAFVFGLTAARTNFCTMGAMSDIVNMGSWARMRTWMLAVAVAILGTAWLSYSGQVDLAKSVPQRPELPWLSLLVGGALFGSGMTLAGGCANRNLVRLGGGSVRSLVVLSFLAIASYMALKGLFAQWRATGSTRCASTWPPLAGATPAWPRRLRRPAASRHASRCRSPRRSWAGACWRSCSRTPAIAATRAKSSARSCSGAVIVAGWYVTGHLGFGENPDTLENVYFAHQHAHAGVAQLRVAAGLRAGAADAVDRQVAAPDVRHGRRAGHHRGVQRMRSRHAAFAGRASRRWPTCAASWRALS